MTGSNSVLGSTAYSYSTNGNLTGVTAPGEAPVTMSYDFENRLREHVQGSSFTTYTYDGNSLKRSEHTSPAGKTTLVWDGMTYLQERQ